MYVRTLLGMLCLGLGSMASAAEVPGTVVPPAHAGPADLATPQPPLRELNPGFGLGVAQLGAFAADSSHRIGVLLELRQAVALSRTVQVNPLISAGLTTPQNTVAMVDWGWRAGGSLARAAGDVTEWVGGGDGDDPFEAFRVMGAVFAYFGIGVAFIAVPVVWISSPIASVGHTMLGTTVSWHHGRAGTEIYVEGGPGFLLYGHPDGTGPAIGYGPLVGIGSQVGKQTWGMRVMVSPPGAHGGLEGSQTDTIVSGALVVGL